MQMKLPNTARERERERENNNNIKQKREGGKKNARRKHTPKLSCNRYLVYSGTTAGNRADTGW